MSQKISSQRRGARGRRSATAVRVSKLPAASRDFVGPRPVTQAVGCIAPGRNRVVNFDRPGTHHRGTVGTNMEGAAVTFDENYRVRVLAQDSTRPSRWRTAPRSSAKGGAAQRHRQGGGRVRDRQAARTEGEAPAVGKRNQVAADAEQRRRKKAELASLRLEKQAELDRLQAEYDSLLRVRQEQELLIEALGQQLLVFLDFETK